MSYAKTFQPVLHNAGSAQPVQALTGASTGTTITREGITTITVTTGEGTAANLVYTLEAPTKGIKKIVAADLNSTKLVSIRTQTSAATFYGSTKNSFAFTTGSTYAPSGFTLYGLSATQWLITSLETPQVTSTAGVDHQVTIAGATA